MLRRATDAGIMEGQAHAGGRFLDCPESIAVLVGRLLGGQAALHSLDHGEAGRRATLEGELAFVHGWDLPSLAVRYR